MVAGRESYGAEPLAADSASADEFDFGVFGRCGGYLVKIDFDRFVAGIESEAVNFVGNDLAVELVLSLPIDLWIAHWPFPSSVLAIAAKNGYTC